jgi:uncharacterized membrane protein YoaK (UPF0700 family)
MAGDGAGGAAAGAHGTAAVRPPTGLLGVLGALTLATGLIDAVSYLGLGRVFVANMTGNVVFMGFALAGATGFSFAASVVALGAFLLGAGIGGRVGAKWSHKRRSWLAAASAAQAALALVALVMTATGVLGTSGDARFGLIALLAVGTGLQNATVRKLAVPDVTTTVLTLTLTGLVADSTLAGGTNPRALRRLAAVAAVLAGAAVGTALMIHQGFTPTLGASAALLGVIPLGFALLTDADLGPDHVAPGSPGEANSAPLR